MSETGDTYIIIPAFNEDPEVLYSVVSQFAEFNIIVVDDGSILDVRTSLSVFPVISGLHIIRHDLNIGQGGAVETGVMYALEKGATTFCTVDADGQHDPASCKAMIGEFLSADCHIILGSRFMGKTSKVPFIKSLFLKGGIWINYFYSGLLLQDAHCGLRVFGREFAEKLHFHNKRQAHASEILWLIHRHKFSYKEFPVKVLYSKYSLQKGQSVWNSFKILSDLIRHRFKA